MASPLLALLARSMRVESRLKPTYIARGTLVLVVAVFLVARVLAAGWTGAPGLAAFESIVLIQFVFITLAGLGYFSSAITEEKEEETLGLLRMTDLNPISILLGKSTSRLIGVLLALLVQLPFTFLAATLGGVSTHQVLACYLALGGYTFFLANLALLASVRASRTGFAAIGVGIALLLLASGRGLSGFLFKTVTLPEQAESVRGLLTFARETLVASSTLARLEQILATGFTGSLASPQLIFDLVAGFACFVCAWVNFERHCGGTIGGGRALIPLYAWSRKRFPPGRPWTRALVWKDAYFVHGGTAVMWAKFVGYGLCLLVLAAGRVVLSPISGFGSISSLAFEGGALCVAVLVLEIGFAGSRMVAAEVREKALSSLAMLPINLPRLYAAKVSACYHAALPAATYAVLCTAAGLISRMLAGGHPSTLIFVAGSASFVLLLVGAETVLLFHLTAWLSLRFPRAALPLGIALVLLGNVFAALMGGLMCGLPIIAAPFAAIMLGGTFRKKLLLQLEQLIAEE